MLNNKNKFLGTLLLSVLAGTTFAKNNPLYLAAKGGYSYVAGIEHKQTLENKDTLKYKGEFKPSFNLGLAVGKYIDDFRVEIEGSYSKASLKKYTESYYTAQTKKTTDTPFKDTGEFSFGNMSFNGYYNIDLKSPFRPFVGIGAGFMFGKVSFKEVVANGYKLEKRKNTELAGSFQAMVGCEYFFAKNASVLLEYRFLGTTKLRFEKLTEKQKNDNKIGDYEDNYMTHSANVGVRYAFA